MSNDRGDRPFSWMPEFLRKFLNFDEPEPQSGWQGGSGYGSQRPAAPSRSTSSSSSWYTAPGDGFKVSGPTFSSSRAPEFSAQEPAARGPSFTPASGSISTPPQTTSYTPTTPAPPPQATSYIPTTPVVPPTPVVGGPVSSASSMPATEGYVQPIGYLLRAYARGALPPQGLENFTKQTRATTEDVWKFYSYWLRFQTDELFRLGREVIDAVTGAPSSTSVPPNNIRRIRVSTGNGAVVVPVEAAPPPPIVPAPVVMEPPPDTTPAPPPNPPLPTPIDDTRADDGMRG